MPVPPGAKGSPAVIPVALPELAAFSSLRIYIPQDLRTQASPHRRQQPANLPAVLSLPMLPVMAKHPLRRR